MKKREPCGCQRAKHWMRVTAARFVVGISCVLFLVTSAHSEYCATEPPPKGLVERCHNLSLVVPERREGLELALVDWMGSCATKSRKFELVLNNPSLDEVWSLIASYRNTPQGTVRIIPQYTNHLVYKNDGRTCYGIGKVKFTVWGASGTVDIDGPIEIIKGPPDDLIKKAAAAAESVLKNSSGSGSLERSKMLNVLHLMTTFGKEFDDTFYSVAPERISNDFMSGMPPACFNEYSITTQGARYECLQCDETLTRCAWPITPLIVEAYLNKMSPAKFEELLLSLANRISRAKQFLMEIQSDSTREMVCQCLQPLADDVARRAAKSTTLYYAWDQ